MIRYPWRREQVENAVAQLDAHWLTKARQRTQALVAAGQFNDDKPIWSTVKPVYMTLQHNKCVFCERQFHGSETGTIEFDLEHFRPKSAVAVWPDARRHPGLRYAFETGAPSERGYHWLAYELSNYSAACKVCNSICKANWFPVAGRRALAAGDDLAAEQALLCNPLDPTDMDPEALLTFRATTAVPRHQDGFLAQRAQLIIDFFQLNREQLHVERARMIVVAGAILESMEASSPASTDSYQLLQSPGLPHANCLRAFARQWQEDPAQGREIRAECLRVALPATSVPH